MGRIKGRRTHSVHHTREDAVYAAHNLGMLMNGVPFGYTFAVMPRMGKWAFVSFPTSSLNTPAIGGAA